MLDHLGAEQVKRVAELAGTARQARDRMIEHMTEAQLAEPPPAKGTHDAGAALGFEPLPSDDPALAALRATIESLPPKARSELLAVALVGTADYARGDWPEALATAENAEVSTLLERADLHDELAKGLYELHLS